MASRLDAQQLERLRGWRNPKERDLSLRDVVGNAARELKRQAHSFGSLGSAWRELAPAGLMERTQLVSLTRGVLTVRCDDASCKFELDRWLRGGGETELIKRASTRLNRVKLVL